MRVEASLERTGYVPDRVLDHVRSYTRNTLLSEGFVSAEARMGVQQTHLVPDRSQERPGLAPRSSAGRASDASQCVWNCHEKQERPVSIRPLPETEHCTHSPVHYSHRTRESAITSTSDND